MGANPSAANVSNNLISQITHYDANFIPPLMANTAAFVWAAEQREQPLHTGVKSHAVHLRPDYRHDSRVCRWRQSGAPEYFGQSFVNAQVAEYNALRTGRLSRPRRLSTRTRPRAPRNCFAYQLGITINNQAYTGLDAQANTDTTVNQNTLISGNSPAYLLTINALRTMRTSS